MRRSIIRASIHVRIRGADHVQGLILHLVHQPRRRRRTAVRDPVPIVARLVSPRVVYRMVVLGGEISGVDLRLLVVVLVTRTLYDVRGVVCRPAVDAV